MNGETIAMLKTMFPELKFQTIFDVETHEGDVASRMMQNFPSAEAHVFEPARQTFDALEQRLQNEK